MDITIDKIKKNIELKLIFNDKIKNFTEIFYDIHNIKLIEERAISLGFDVKGNVIRKSHNNYSKKYCEYYYDEKENLIYKRCDESINVIEYSTHEYTCDDCCEDPGYPEIDVIEKEVERDFYCFEYNFYNKGKLLKKSYFNKKAERHPNKKTEKIYYKYNENGNLIEKKFINAHNSFGEEVQNFYLIYDTRYHYNVPRTENPKNIFKYDKKGNKIEEKLYDLLGNDIVHIIYKYDEKGNVIEINQQNSDGSYVIITNKYDEKGRTIEHNIQRPEYNKTKYIYKYNENDVIIEINVFVVTNNDRLFLHRKVINEFLSKSLIEQKIYDSNDSLIEKYHILITKRETYSYDENNNLIEQIIFERHHLNLKKNYYYDDNNNLVELTIFNNRNELKFNEINCYDRNNNIICKIIKEHPKKIRRLINKHYFYKYDEMNNLIEENEYNEFGMLISKKEHAFDIKGRIVRKAQYNYEDSGLIMKSEEYYKKYDMDGNLIEEIRHYDDKYTHKNYKIIYKHDKHGNIIEEIRYYDDKSQTISKYKYEFDEKGNWIRKYAYINDNENKLLNVRHIEYWN